MSIDERGGQVPRIESASAPPAPAPQSDPSLSPPADQPPEARLPPPAPKGWVSTLGLFAVAGILLGGLSLPLAASPWHSVAFKQIIFDDTTLLAGADGYSLCYLAVGALSIGQIVVNRLGSPRIRPAPEESSPRAT